MHIFRWVGQSSQKDDLPHAGGPVTWQGQLVECRPAHRSSSDAPKLQSNSGNHSEGSRGVSADTMRPAARSIRVGMQTPSDSFPLHFLCHLLWWFGELGLRATSACPSSSWHVDALVLLTNPLLDFSGGPVVKNLPANAGDTGTIPDLGRSHMLQGN